MRASVLLEIDKENASEGRGSVSDTVSKARAMCEHFTVPKYSKFVNDQRPSCNDFRANFEPRQKQWQF